MARVSIDANYVLADSGGVALAAGAGTAADLTDGNEFTNDGSITLVVENTDASAVNLTVDIPSSKDVDGQVVPSKVVSIPAGETHLFRFPTAQYGTVVGIDGGAATMLFSLLR